VRSPNFDASWTRFSDPNAGIFSYEYNIVTDDNKILLPYNSNGRWPAATVALAYEQMQHNLALEIQVRARNFAFTLSETIKSPAVFDLDPPQCRL
jgi:hypothetical protein